MKKVLLCIWCISTPVIAFSQDDESVTLSKLRLNFTIPDMPAFQSLGTEPSNLLRPSTPHALAVSTSEFYKNNSLSIPEAFAVEVSPALLLNMNKGPQELMRYADNRIINSLRISLGTTRDSSITPFGRALAVGFRVSLIDKGDLATDKEALQQIANALKDYRLDERECRRLFAESLGVDTIKKWAGDSDPSHTTLDEIIDWDVYLNAKLNTDATVAQQYEDFKTSGQCDIKFDTWIQEFKERYKRNNWNADKLDIAVSVLTSSRDSLVQNIAFSKADVWATWAKRVGKNGQLLVGVNGRSYKNVIDTNIIQKNTYYTVSIPARFLFGTNRVKGFVEAQYTFNSESSTQSSFFHLGTELNIIDGIWLNFYSGIIHNFDLNKNNLIANMNLKLTLPEKFNFF